MFSVPGFSSEDHYCSSFSSTDHFFSYPGSDSVLSENSSWRWPPNIPISINNGTMNKIVRLTLSIITGIFTLGLVHLGFWIRRKVIDCNCTPLLSDQKRTIENFLYRAKFLSEPLDQNALNFNLNDMWDSRKISFIRTHFLENCKEEYHPELMQYLTTTLNQNIGKNLQSRFPQSVIPPVLLYRVNKESNCVRIYTPYEAVIDQAISVEIPLEASKLEMEVKVLSKITQELTMKKRERIFTELAALIRQHGVPGLDNTSGGQHPADVFEIETRNYKCTLHQNGCHFLRKETDGSETRIDDLVDEQTGLLRESAAVLIYNVYQELKIFNSIDQLLDEINNEDQLIAESFEFSYNGDNVCYAQVVAGDGQVQHIWNIPRQDAIVMNSHEPIAYLLIHEKCDLLEKTIQAIKINKEIQGLTVNVTFIEAMRRVKRAHLSGNNQQSVIDISTAGSRCTLAYIPESSETEELFVFKSENNNYENDNFEVSFLLQEDIFALHSVDVKLIDPLKRKIDILCEREKRSLFSEMDQLFLFSAEREEFTIEQEAKKLELRVVDQGGCSLVYSQGEERWNLTVSKRADGSLLFINNTTESEENNIEVLQQVRVLLEANRPKFSINFSGIFGSQDIALTNNNSAIRSYFHKIGEIIRFGPLTVRYLDGMGQDAGGLSRDFITNYFRAGIKLFASTDDELKGNFALRQYGRTIGLQKEDFESKALQYYYYGKMCQVAYLGQDDSRKMPTGRIFSELFFEVVQTLRQENLQQRIIGIRDLLDAKMMIAEKLVSEKSEDHEHLHLLPTIQYLKGENSLEELFTDGNFLTRMGVVFESYFIQEDFKSDWDGDSLDDDVDKFVQGLRDDPQLLLEFEKYLEFSIDISVGEVLHPIIAIAKGMNSMSGVINLDRKITLHRMKQEGFADDLQGKCSRNDIIDVLVPDIRVEDQHSPVLARKIEWLKEYFQICEEKMLADFLMFATGAPTILSGQQIKCSLAASPLVSSHTCSIAIDLCRDPHQTKEDFIEKLIESIAQCDSGFLTV